MALTIHLDSKELEKLATEKVEKIEARFLELLVEAMREVVLPAMRRITPIRTGRLRDSIRMVVRGNRIAIVIDDARAAAYYPFQRRQQLPEQHLAQFRRLIEEIVPMVVDQVIKELAGSDG